MLAAFRSTARTTIQRALRRAGYELQRFEGVGQHPLADARGILAVGAPLVFDVGANHGQTITRIRHFMPGATFHSFEPSEEAFAELSRRHGSDPGITLNRLALGAAREERELFENVSSDLSSFLPLGKHGWGSVARSTVVPIDTLDAYCDERAVDRIDLLKLDTQGFEREVLRGSSRMLAGRRVSLILTEVHFAAVYDGATSLCEVEALLAPHGFVLVSLYGIRHLGYRAGWGDALFVEESRLA